MVSEEGVAPVKKTRAKPAVSAKKSEKQPAKKAKAADAKPAKKTSKRTVSSKAEK